MSKIDLSNFDVPGRGGGLLDLFRRRYLLSVLIRKSTATRYRNSALGWVWSYVKPLIQFFIYWAVMGFIFGMDRGLENYPLYLFSGFIVVSFFTEAFGNATTAIVDNKALVQKIYLPRELFPIASLAVAFVHFLPQLAILLVVALIYGWVPSFLGIGAALLALLIVGAAALGLGIFFAGINVRFRDAQNFVDVLRQLATWASPVLYTWQLIQDNMPAWVFYIWLVNPITIAVELFHYAFWAPTIDLLSADGAARGGWPGFAPNFEYFGAGAILLCVIFLVVGQLTFRRYERSFAQDL